MNRFLIFLLSAVFATGAYAASHVGAMPAPAKTSGTPEAQAQGSDQAKRVAETKHKAKVHGSDKSAQQLEAQMPGSDKAKSRAEAKHKAKVHTGKMNSTDEGQARDSKKL